MEKKKIYKLIDECRKGMREIDDAYLGAKRIVVHEKEENFYKPKFKELEVNPKIISDIYNCRNDNEGINKIKRNIEVLLIKN